MLEIMKASPQSFQQDLDVETSSFSQQGEGFSSKEYGTPQD
jgi:hypothetical protein